MKSFSVISCVLFMIANSGKLIGLSFIPKNLTTSIQDLLGYIPPDIVADLSFTTLFNCSLPQNDSFADRTPTATSGSIVLRFYNGTDANSNQEISLPITDGTVLVDLQGFDKTKKTLFYFFGYKENSTVYGVQTIVNAYIKQGGYNIFVVDWSAFACLDFLSAVAACSTIVPKSVGDAINQMADEGYPKILIEVVAHSTGAQCAGYMGRNYVKDLPIIVGLDPAGPGFTCLNGLHKGDASFVHIIHTDRGFYGTVFTCGDFDVILNKDGVRFQPGCPCVLPPLSFTYREVCSHHLSWEVYGASVSGSAEFFCVKCDTYDDFEKNTCEHTKLMALYGADTSSTGNCYMKTSGVKPYGLGEQGTTY